MGSRGSLVFSSSARAVLVDGSGGRGGDVAVTLVMPGRGALSSPVSASG